MWHPKRGNPQNMAMLVMLPGTWQHAPEHGIVGLLQVNFYITFLFHNVAPVDVFSLSCPGNMATCPGTWHSGAAAG